MADWYSGWSVYGGYNLARAHLSLIRSGNTINYVVGLQTAPTASLLGTVTGTTSQGAINTPVNMGSSAYVGLKSGSYSSPGATSFSASVTPPIGGTLNVSGSLAANGSPPATAPSAPTFTRVGTSGRDLTLSWTAVAGATGYKLDYKHKWVTGAGSASLGSTTGTSFTSTGFAADSYVCFWVQATNGFGSGPWSPVSARFYTPAAKPAAPELTFSGTQVTGTIPGTLPYNRYGLEIERSTGGTLSPIGNGVDGATANSFSETIPTDKTTKYRVRRFAGPEGANTRVYSDWSDWSKTVLDAGYVRPDLTGTAQRATGTMPNPAGTTLRVTATGSASTLFADNKMTVRARSRVKGTTTWSGYTNSPVVNANAGSFNTTWNLPVSALIVNTYEIEISVVDSYGSTLTITEVGVGEVALSLSKTGAAVGKVWEPGGATLQVAGDLEVTGRLIEADSNILVVDGVEYERSGTFTVNVPTLLSWGNLYYNYVSIPLSARNSPPGYKVVYTVINGRIGSYWTTGTDNGTSLVIVSAQSTAGSNVLIGWQLVKI